MVKLGNDWQALLAPQFEAAYYKKLRSFLAAEYKTQTIYPDMHCIFAALQHTSYADTSVVILGQDPYHGPGQAHGFCFSVQEGATPPPSLVNIFKEIKNDIGTPPPPNGCLTRWAAQGVLLLNTVLTVRAGQAHSHKGLGWETFTDAVISLLNGKEQPVVFLLWGASARAKKALITNPQHTVLEAVHPSPLSAYGGFFGCGHFSKTNALLRDFGRDKITW